MCIRDSVSWEKAEDIERVGMESKKVEILGAEVPVMVIPVRPGRDLARLVEVAAFHTQLLLLSLIHISEPTRPY